MRPKTNRLLMLLVGAVISGCASQTERSSSGGGAGSQAVAEAPAPKPTPAPPYEPQKESVQYVDRPLEESPPPKKAVVAVAPKDEATPDFPVTKYELPEDEEVEDLGTQEDESVSAEQEAVSAGESSVGETTEYADSDEEEVADLGTLDDESVSAEQEAASAEESSVGETTEYADSDEEEVADLGTQDDESVSAEQETATAGESSVGGTTEYADSDQEEEVEDLGTQPDDSGTVKFPEEKRAAADNLVGEPKIYADEPAPKATPAAPKKTAPAAPTSFSVNFETEPLFSFNKSEIRGDQRAKLDEFVSGLKGAQYDSIVVVGHADRIGSDAYNQKLSERRASAVRDYLVKKGIPSDKIHTEGRGESEPVTGNACNKTRGKALISCLQPDRRVDVSVSATKKSN
jgi:outer membrane protein OmpA-like peptidoglycan-associated protein